MAGNLRVVDGSLIDGGGQGFTLKFKIFSITV